MNKQDTNILSTSTSGSSGWQDVSQFEDWAVFVSKGGSVKIYIAYGSNLNQPWNGFQDYNVGDCAQYQGTSYICIQNNVSAQAIDPTNASYWTAITGIIQNGGSAINAGQVFSNQSCKDNASSPANVAAHWINVVAQSNVQTEVQLYARSGF